MKLTIENTKQWKNKVEICRNFTSVCVQQFPNEYFDFIYVDARHDYKGVSLDLKEWWPKLKHGGIMAGHDYVLASDVKGQDFSLNFDGTRDTTGRITKGAVDDFFNMAEHLRQLTVSYREPMWNSWA
eukprot:1127370_1